MENCSLCKNAKYCAYANICVKKNICIAQDKQEKRKSNILIAKRRRAL